MCRGGLPDLQLKNKIRNRRIGGEREPGDQRGDRAGGYDALGFLYFEHGASRNLRKLLILGGKHSNCYGVSDLVTEGTEEEKGGSVSVFSASCPFG